MKKSAGIWIDGSKAVIVTLANGSSSVSRVESEIENKVYHREEGDQGAFIGVRHANREKKFQERKHQQEKKFLANVYGKVKDMEEVVIFGPAKMKTELNKVFKKHKNTQQFVKSVSVTDKLSDNQIIAKVKSFFNHS